MLHLLWLLASQTIRSCTMTMFGVSIVIPGCEAVNTVVPFAEPMDDLVPMLRTITSVCPYRQLRSILFIMNLRG
jgi:hypothetical protein